MAEALFIQFAKEPVPGLVKTRMLAALSPREACELHRELVLWTTRTLSGAGLGEVELHVSGDSASPLFRQCLDLGLAGLRQQRGANLGERMYRAMADGLARSKRVILVGSDCPGIDAAYLRQALSALDDAEVVLGPARDGGYVLIGARSVERSWFEGLEWGGDTVYADTVERLEASGARWQALPALQDIDRPGDLPAWHAIREPAP